MSDTNNKQKLSYSEQLRQALLKKNGAGGKNNSGKSSKNGNPQVINPKSQAPKSKGGMQQKSQRGV